MTTQARRLNEMMVRYRISDVPAERNAATPARPEPGFARLGGARRADATATAERRNTARPWGRQATPRTEVAKVATATAQAGQRYARLPADNAPDWEEF
jgi:hypothetical protein